MSDTFEDLEDTIDRLETQVERHRRILNAIEEDPDIYGDELVETYTSNTQQLLDSVDLFDGLEETVEKLENQVNSAEEAKLANIELHVDHRKIEGVEITEFEPEGDPPRAVAFVPSPKVNQVRGGRQQLVTGNANLYDFKIEKTLVADMEEDKTGTLKLVLNISPAET